MDFHLPKNLSQVRMPKFGERPAPSRDWLILLILSFVILLASVGWNVWTFFRITNGEVVGDERATVTGPDISAVEKVRAVFGERALEEQRYRSEYRFVDPAR